MCLHKISNARCPYPSVIVLVKHANKLAGLELKLVLHAGLELELHTVNIVRATGDRNSGSSHDLSRACSRSRRAVYGSVTLRSDAFGPVVTLLRDNCGIAEWVLSSVGRSV